MATCLFCGAGNVSPLSKVCQVCYNLKYGAPPKIVCTQCGDPNVKSIGLCASCLRSAAFKQQQYYTSVSQWGRQYGTSPNPQPKGAPQVSPSPGSIKIWWDVTVQAYRMVTPYNANFVEAIKKSIPVSDRQYDPSTKIWTFVEKYCDAMKAVVEQVFHVKATVVTRLQAEQAQAPPRSGGANSPLDSVIIRFFKNLTYDAAQKAYREGALTLHPDRGGSLDKMSQFNADWDRLRKELFQK